MKEEEIIRKAKAGDNDALDYMINKYHPLVVNLSRKYFLIGGTDEDLIQEGDIGLFKAIISYDETKKVSFYNFCKLCIERNLQTAITKANNNKNRTLNNFESLDEYNDNPYLLIEDSSSNPEEKLISQEIFQELKNRIKEKFSTLEKQVLYHFVKGESYAEIAENLQVSTKSVDNALKRIRKKLSDFIPE